MLITPTLHFRGQCEQAIALYQKAFDMKVDFILRYRDADKRDWNAELTDEEKGYVYHSEAHIGGQRFMLADDMNQPEMKVTSIFLTITFDTAEEVETAFDILKDGGEIVYPLHRTTYSSRMGTVIDPYGFRWGLMTEHIER